MAIATGSRLRSTVSPAEVVVVKAPEADGPITCGGAEMVTADTPADTTATAEGPLIAIGKRYVNEAASIELLVVKAGAGPLAFAGEELTIKSAKPLPASD